MRTTTALLSTAAALALAGAPVSGQPAPPTPKVAVQSAMDAAGGLRAFSAMSILMVEVRSNEVTSDGETRNVAKRMAILPPGPVPGRLEAVESRVIAGDDGKEGWALTSGKPDQRMSTTYMVRRIIGTNLFPVLLPFSLNWDGVTVAEVLPAKLGNLDTWRLRVQFSKAFFSSPQIASEWTIDLDRNTWAVVRAESPHTDLGKGIVADGMRYSWENPVQVVGVWLPGTQRVVGLDEQGRERAHSRVDQMTYQMLPNTDGPRLFANPIPPDQRPKLPAMKAPEGVRKP